MSAETNAVAAFLASNIRGASARANVLEISSVPLPEPKAAPPKRGLKANGLEYEWSSKRREEQTLEERHVQKLSQNLRHKLKQIYKGETR